MNVSVVDNLTTARTNLESASQRAFNLHNLNVKHVLELCVGPSLKTLSEQYKQYNIKCTGNDIDIRWKNFYPEGDWIIENCLNIEVSKFDCLVFAPPLSKGCTGRREDSLSIDKVTPSYYDFIECYKNYNGIKVLVLPARALSTRYDKDQFYNLLSKLPINYSVKILTEGHKQIRKYVDIYYI